MTTSPEKRRAYNLKKKYGMTVAEYDAMFVQQGGVCAICHRPPKKIRLACDHDHAIEKKEGKIVVRGLLCSMCNRKIVGVIERYKVHPQAIADYLSKAAV